MYASRTTKILVAIFALAGLAALVVLTTSLRGVAIFEPSGYVLYTTLDQDASGLKANNPVELNGVLVGKVLSVRLKDLRTHLALLIDDGVRINRCATVSLKTEDSVLVTKFVSIESQSNGPPLMAHDTIGGCHGPVVLEQAIGAYGPHVEQHSSLRRDS